MANPIESLESTQQKEQKNTMKPQKKIVNYNTQTKLII